MSLVKHSFYVLSCWNNCADTWSDHLSKLLMLYFLLVYFAVRYEFISIFLCGISTDHFIICYGHYDLLSFFLPKLYLVLDEFILAGELQETSKRVCISWIFNYLLVFLVCLYPELVNYSSYFGAPSIGALQSFLAPCHELVIYWNSLSSLSPFLKVHHPRWWMIGFNHWSPLDAQRLDWLHLTAPLVMICVVHCFPCIMVSL